GLPGRRVDPRGRAAGRHRGDAAAALGFGWRRHAPPPGPRADRRAGTPRRGAGDRRRAERPSAPGSAAGAGGGRAGGRGRDRGCAARRRDTRGGLAAALLHPGQPMGLPLNASQVSARAERLHRDALVVDLHADTPTEFFLDASYDFGVRHEDGHIDLPRLREGGVDAQFMIAWDPAERAAEPGASGAHALRLVDAVRDVAARTPGARLATSAAEIEAARASGDVALLIGVEGGHALENSLEMLGRFHAAGVRYMTLTWNNANDWADACCSPPRHGGLTEFGREVIREMNRLGMLVDVSHAADTTVAQVPEGSAAPILASHSCARALARLPRNVTDEQARAIARRGGVIGVNFFPTFLDDLYGARFESLTKEMESRAHAAYAAHGDRERARREANAWLRSQRDAQSGRA